jgi:SAM-dependent methyltransferase
MMAGTITPILSAVRRLDPTLQECNPALDFAVAVERQANGPGRTESYRRRRDRWRDPMNYRLAYSIGFHPWEDAATDPPFAEKFSELMDREESDLTAPFGRALDVGTGSGVWGIELARRGWQVTGIDMIETALARGRARVQDAGVDMKLVQGDVTKLIRSPIGDGFRLILDTGTFHDFDERERLAMGREIDSVAGEDATVFLLVWPKRFRPLIRGATRSEIEEAFPSWRITHVEPSHFRAPKMLELILRPDEHWYRLRRR